MAEGRPGEAKAFAMRLVARFAEAVGAPRLIACCRGPYRRLPLSWRGQPRLRRAARRGRRQSRGADDAQCRLGRPHPSRAFSRRRGARLGRNPADAGPRGARLRAELHLRALPDAVPAEASATRSPGPNPMPSSSPIRSSARAPTAMAISSTLPAPSPAACRTTACIGRRTAAPASSSTCRVVACGWEEAGAGGHRRRPCGGRALRATCIPAILGLPAATNEDDLKALGAAAASTGCGGACSMPSA